MTENPAPPVVVLRGGGTTLVFDSSSRLPCVIHWGADLGPLGSDDLLELAHTAIPSQLNGAPDVPRTFPILAGEDTGWVGRPGLVVSRDGHQLACRFVVESQHLAETHDRVAFVLADKANGVRVVLSYALDSHGVVTADATVSSTGEGSLAVEHLDLRLPLPHRAAEILDFSGKWARERSPQRFPVVDGVHSREGRRGKTGLDSPYVMSVGTESFTHRTGEVWSMHVAWSGDSSWHVERLPEGAGSMTTSMGGGELLRIGEVRLENGESYTSPRVFFVWSPDGLDGVRNRFHSYMRARSSHPSSPRPLTLNSWEAVYFDHNHQKLAKLVERASSIGVERFVLDDGWFHARHDDTAGLGDWWVDEQTWPHGLTELANQVHGLGMEFGLWFEPEMINLDSDTARAHPEWLLAPSTGVGLPSRNQHVLNIANPEAWASVLDRIDALVTAHAIDYIKWDHNRDLLEAARRGSQADRVGSRAQTHATYALMDELRRRHPQLEIESCAGGGGRIDLGVLERTDRVWGSDCIDPVERQSIQRWTTLLIPPELMGSHVGDRRSHTTNREADQPFRMTTALFAHSGIESDLTLCSDTELESFQRWGALYKEKRSLIHTGTAVTADMPGVGVMLHGVVAQDGSSALFEWAQLGTEAIGQYGRTPIPGLNPNAHYRIRVREDVGTPRWQGHALPAWVTKAAEDGLVVSGTILTVVGLPLPALDPQQSLLFELEREPVGSHNDQK
ncbi:alpha-galactosidase [Demequina aurantiaca]|uniref:alpha-galactosidase n=1 Tax=Demequina aurantiaca TaxID=676200 RepID=UPI0007808850|nr:alpha-galactosidase [Demequina aurantiaca]